MVQTTMSWAVLELALGARVSKVSVVSGAAAVSTSGTDWKKVVPWPGLSQASANLLRIYSTVFSSPGVPGLPPSKSSEARAAIVLAEDLVSSQGMDDASFAQLARLATAATAIRSHSDLCACPVLPYEFVNFSFCSFHSAA